MTQGRHPDYTDQPRRNQRPVPLLLQESVLNPVVRICLRCNQEFSSTGDRLCLDCNEKNSRSGKRVDRGSTYRKTYNKLGG